MTDSEQRRADEQRRIADTVIGLETLKSKGRNEGIMVIIAVMTFFGSIIIYISRSQSREEIRPISEQVIMNTATIKAIKENQLEMLSILKELRNKK